MRLDRVAPEEERMGATPSPHSTRKESVFPTSRTRREEHDITGYLANGMNPKSGCFY